MSSGSPRRFPSHHQAQELERFWSDPAILAWLSKPHAAENKALKPWIKRTELERIEKPPLDLDCSPYYQDPDSSDLKILRRLQELGVKDASHPT